MKKIIIICISLLLAVVIASAQNSNVTVAEPEFVNSYCILTSDSTYAILPKESGSIGKHQNKVRKWSKILGNASVLGSAAGMIGIGTAGSLGGMMTGARVMTTASGVGSAASAVSGLTGASGMDVIFKGGHSAYSVKADGQDVRLLVKGESNEADPMDCYRIVRFNASKKDRRIQWMEWEPSLLGSEDAEKSGYLQFSGHKYGERSYLITIPASSLKEGEYGVFYMSIITATVIPVGTFTLEK